MQCNFMELGQQEEEGEANYISSNNEIICMLPYKTPVQMLSATLRMSEGQKIAMTHEKKISNKCGQSSSSTSSTST